MTPVLWLDPVAACAVANDCTRFGGQVPGHTRGSNWDWVPCGDCNGTGLVQPSGPQTMLIGATAVKPGKVGDWMMVPPSSVVTNGEWIAQRWEGSTCMERMPIHPASILGTATIELVPIEEAESWFGGTSYSHRLASVVVFEDTLTFWRAGAEDGEDISEALPFGSWTPGGLAAIATDFRPTIDCPELTELNRGAGLCSGCAERGRHVILRRHNWDDQWRCPDCYEVFRLERTLIACPLPWPAAPSSPCVTTLDLAELGAA